MNTNEQVSNATPIVVVKNEPATVTARVITMPMPNDLTEEMFRIYNMFVYFTESYYNTIP